MTFSPVHGAVAGVILTGAIVAFVLHPAVLTPHAAPTPSLAVPDDSARTHPAPRATPASTIVYVAGAVARPGVYALANDARALDAVTKAGGFSHDADTVAVNLAAHVADGDEIAVPRLGDAPAAASNNHRRIGRHATKRGHRGRRRRTPRSDAADDTTATTDAPSQAIDLNAADAMTLATIPGIGPTLAERIVEFRVVNGPFASVDGLADVSGVTASRFDAIASYLTVRP